MFIIVNFNFQMPKVSKKRTTASARGKGPAAGSRPTRVTRSSTRQANDEENRPSGSRSPTASTMSTSGSEQGENRSQASIMSVASDDELPRDAPLPASGSVTAHLDEKIIQKVVQGRYVHLSSLLPNTSTSSKLVFNPQTGSLDTSSNNKRLFNYSEWLDAFFIFATVRGEAHPAKAVSMFKYMQTVKRIKDRGGNFVKYDETFRAKHKGAPSIPWGDVDPEEMLWACNDPAYTPYNQFKSLKRRDKPTANIRFPLPASLQKDLRAGVMPSKTVSLVKRASADMYIGA